jgi:myo-inositol-1(or 4)-monophosphatase
VRRPAPARTCSLDLAYVAAGRQDGFWEFGPSLGRGGRHPARARGGGRVGRLEGDDDILAEGTLVAGNPEIYLRLRGILEDARGPA